MKFSRYICHGTRNKCLEFVKFLKTITEKWIFINNCSINNISLNPAAKSIFSLSRNIKTFKLDQHSGEGGQSCLGRGLCPPNAFLRIYLCT